MATIVYSETLKKELIEVDLSHLVADTAPVPFFYWEWRPLKPDGDNVARYPELYRARSADVRFYYELLCRRYVRDRLGFDAGDVPVRAFRGQTYAVGQWIAATRESGQIEIREDVAPALFLFGLLHELVHACQELHERRLDSIRGTWDGRCQSMAVVTTPYNRLPWEMDANDRALWLAMEMHRAGELPAEVDPDDVREIYVQLVENGKIPERYYETDPRAAWMTDPFPVLVHSDPD